MGSLPDGQGVPNAIPLEAPSKFFFCSNTTDCGPHYRLIARDRKTGDIAAARKKLVAGNQVSNAPPFLLLSHKNSEILMWESNMNTEVEIRDGMIALMVLKTGNAVRSGIAHRIGPASGDLFAIDHGTHHPVLGKLEHETSITSEWEFHRLAKAGRKQLAAEGNQWDRVSKNGKRLLAWEGAEA
jgi:PadR family transcriptional regulator, regulatory protein PadR